MATQAFIIKFNFDNEDFDQLDELEDSIERIVTYHNLGTFNDYELSDDGSKGEFYITTTDAELLYKNLKPILFDSRLLRGGKVEIQEFTPGGENRQVKEYQL